MQTYYLCNVQIKISDSKKKIDHESVLELWISLFLSWTSTNCAILVQMPHTRRVVLALSLDTTWKGNTSNYGQHIKGNNEWKTITEKNQELSG